MTRKVFVVPDIHGEYDKLLRLMDKILDKRTNDDLIIFLGDYIDRGKQSNRVINYIFNLKLTSARAHLLCVSKSTEPFAPFDLSLLGNGGEHFVRNTSFFSVMHGF